MSTSIPHEAPYLEKNAASKQFLIENSILKEEEKILTKNSTKRGYSSEKRFTLKIELKSSTNVKSNIKNAKKKKAPMLTCHTLG